jgi:hypothetical protein
LESPPAIRLNFFDAEVLTVIISFSFIVGEGSACGGSVFAVFQRMVRRLPRLANRLASEGSSYNPTVPVEVSWN